MQISQFAIAVFITEKSVYHGMRKQLHPNRPRTRTPLRVGRAVVRRATDRTAYGLENRDNHLNQTIMLQLSVFLGTDKVGNNEGRIQTSSPRLGYF